MAVQEYEDEDVLPSEYAIDGDSDSDGDSGGLKRMPKAARAEIIAEANLHKGNYVDVVTTLAELNTHQQRILVARGGEPGTGNRHLRSTEQARPLGCVHHAYCCPFSAVCPCLCRAVLLPRSQTRRTWLATLVSIASWCWR